MLEPFSAPLARTGTLDNWLEFVALLAVWFALQTWVLPKLGVPT